MMLLQYGNFELLNHDTFSGNSVLLIVCDIWSFFTKCLTLWQTWQVEKETRVQSRWKVQAAAVPLNQPFIAGNIAIA